ncbi:PhiH1 repressor-like protein [Halorubrum distributum JCM 9100]|uniref:PhiH1 repressor-like protein n=3 Tax=Halorubrum distributum TaxID=29283 RepID=M0EI17_9EURY|nr:winged helix-turn-helix domain-containing protein [Halorubrum distributum]ELZ46034.1 PhiH1 repressor-like protein [Halorubrum distributum JCM 9100]ELZ50133.1 PhiH1 repressor-like protein [Halorubrum distributum JCM 10118]
MTRSDYYILEAMADPEILHVQSPTILAYNLDISRPYVSNRLGELVERGFVEKVEDGKYRITEEGRQILSQE